MHKLIPPLITISVLCFVLFIFIPSFALAQSDDLQELPPETEMDQGAEDLAELDAELSEYFESFIAFQVRKTQGDTFFRVMMNIDETPYLNVDIVMKKWMEMKGKCQLEQLLCQYVLHFNNERFILDGQKKLLSRSTSTMSFQIPENGMIIVEDQIWLRYDLWKDWVPVSITWSLSRYLLKFLLSYPSLKALAGQRQNQREKYQKFRKDKAELESIPAVYPKEKFRNELRYKVRAAQEVDNIQQDAIRTQDIELTYEYNADILKGTLRVSGNVSQIQQEVATESLNFSTWKYTRYGQKYFHLFEMGDIKLDRQLLMPSLLVNTGVHIQRLEQRKGAGNISLRGFAPIGTEVDLYHNGLLIGSTVVTQEALQVGIDVLSMFEGEQKIGIYQFEDIVVEGGGLMSLQLFYNDGSYKEEIIRIASDNSLILAPREFDYQVYYGKAEKDTVLYANFRYGVISNVSAGLHAYSVEQDPSVEGMESNQSFFSFDLALRPFYGISLLSEFMSSGTGGGQALLSYISYFFPHSIEFELRLLDETSPVYEYFSGDEKSPEYKRIRHSVGLGRWFWMAEYMENLSKQQLDLNIRYRVSSRISSFYEPQFEKSLELPAQSTHIIGAEMTSEHHAARLAQIISDTSSDTTFRYQFQGKKVYNWDFSFSLSRSQEGNASFTTMLVWKPREEFSARLSASEGERTAQATWTDIITQKNGPKSSNDFGTGTLTGVVMIPARGDQVAYPLGGVTVTAGSKKGVTDSKGRYIITGIPPYQRISVGIDPASLDVGLTPLKSFEILQFRPSTHIRYSPQLTWSTGLDGMVEREIPSDRDVFIYVVDQRGNVFKKVKLESDGFFIIEGLVPGVYQLEVRGLDDPLPPASVVIEEGMDWVPAIQFEASDQTIIPLESDSPVEQ